MASHSAHDESHSPEGGCISLSTLNTHPTQKSLIGIDAEIIQIESIEADIKDLYRQTCFTRFSDTRDNIKRNIKQLRKQNEGQADRLSRELEKANLQHLRTLEFPDDPSTITVAPEFSGEHSLQVRSKRFESPV
jgi:hypothetical protein